MKLTLELTPFSVKFVFFPFITSLLASNICFFCIPVPSFGTWHYSHGCQLEEANRLPWKVIKIQHR